MSPIRILSTLVLAGMLAACQDAPTAPANLPAVPQANVQRGWIFDVDGTPIEVSYTIVDGRAIHEGDIDLGAAGTVAATRQALLQREGSQPGGPRQGATINGSSHRWANGVVPYVISGSFNATQQQMIVDAMAHISANVPGVTFQPRSGQSSYASFAPHASACSSAVGRQGGSQTINLAPGCFVLGIVVHEILHTLGMWHEQSRCDRDAYITVNGVRGQRLQRMDRVPGHHHEHVVHRHGAPQHGRLLLRGPLRPHGVSGDVLQLRDRGGLRLRRHAHGVHRRARRRLLSPGRGRPGLPPRHAGGGRSVRAAIDR